MEQPGELLSFDVTVEAGDLPVSKASGEITDSLQLRSYPASFAPGKKMDLTLTLSQ